MTARNTGDLIARRHAVVARGVGQAAGDLAIVRARGARLVDDAGRELIDFAGGIGTVNAGHCPPEVVAAIRAQSERLIHTCFHVATYEPYVALCEALVARLPHGEDGTRAALFNTGAEAVENAIKIARQATQRQAIIAFSEAFHGRTFMAMSLTSKTGYKLGCGPFAPEVYRLDFPNHFLRGDGLTLERFVARELARLEDAFVSRVPADHVAAVIIEPVQGEGGFVPAPKAYLQGLRRLCDRHGILLIADEVQTGFGRTGRWAAYEHAGITPDLSTWAKSMGGGLPISAVIGRADVMNAARPGTLGGTYGGNPVSCAAALANIGVLESQQLIARAHHLGELIRARLTALARQTTLVADVRGLGAMMAVELCHAGDPSRPAGAAVKAILERCRDQGVVMLAAGSHGQVIRLLAPLVITEDDLDRGLSVLESAVIEVAAQRTP